MFPPLFDIGFKNLESINIGVEGIQLIFVVPEIRIENLVKIGVILVRDD